MISSKSQKKREKGKNYFKKGFLKHFIYNIFERSNETPNIKKDGKDGDFGSKKLHY